MRIASMILFRSYWHGQRSRLLKRRRRFAAAASFLFVGAPRAWRHSENAMFFSMSDVKPVSRAISVAVLLTIGSLTIVPATAKEGVARCRAIRHGIQRRDCFEFVRQKSQEPRKARAKDTSPLTPHDPASTSSIDHLSAVLGRPLCVDRDTLAAMLVAGVFASRPTEVATNGCQAIPWDAEVELLERYPSGLHFLRIIKVKMTSPGQPDSTVGFTIETGR